MTSISEPPTGRASAPNPDRLLGVAAGFMTAKMTFVANEIGLFAALGAHGATIEELAAKCEASPRGVRIAADVLVACGLLERDGERYVNTPDTAAFLSGHGPFDLRTTLRYWDLVSYPGATNATRAIRTGQGVHDELGVEQTEAYERFVAESTTPSALALAKVYDFSSHKRVLDVGGGLGTLLRPVLREYPSLTGVLVDLPTVTELARAELATGPTAGRVEVVAADVLVDPLPAGSDVVILAHLAHLFSPEQNITLLERLRDVTPPGGRLLLVDWWRHWQVPPPAAAVAAAEFLMISGGDSYRPDEIAEWLEETGWALMTPEPRPLADLASLLIAEAA